MRLKPWVSWRTPSNRPPKRSPIEPIQPWLSRVPFSPRARSNSPLVSVGTGVDSRLSAPPVVRGPACTEAAPFFTSTACMRAMVGK